MPGRRHDLLASSDFISIHLVLGDRTRGLVDHAGSTDRAVMKTVSHRCVMPRAGRR
jgi:hypothetical protein